MFIIVLRKITLIKKSRNDLNASAKQTNLHLLKTIFDGTKVKKKIDITFFFLLNELKCVFLQKIFRNINHL